MVNWPCLIIGVVVAFIFCLYSIFWRPKFSGQSEFVWFILYVLLPVVLFFGGITLIYLGAKDIVLIVS